MSLWSWFDSRTLFSCQVLAALVFATLFFAMRRANPTLRGVGSIAFSFLFGVAGILLLFLRGSIPNFLSMTIASALVLTAFTLQYSATLRFLGVSRSFSPIWVLNAGVLLIIFYFGQIQHSIVARIIASSLAIAVIRALISMDLLRHTQGRTHIRLFGIVMAIFAVLSCTRAIVSYLNRAPSNYLQQGNFQTIAMGGDLLYICLLGMFFCAMINSKILAVITDQSEQDTLLGILNRRGIESRLAVELKRAERSTQKLCVALVDIDYFKTINDTDGHAAGDNALCSVVTAISTKLRAYDLLGRFGGDEFLLILPQTPVGGALIVAERIGEAARSLPAIYRGRPLSLSIGLTEAVPSDDSTSLLSRADQALYQAKHVGRNCTRVVLTTLEHTDGEHSLTGNSGSSTEQYSNHEFHQHIGTGDTLRAPLEAAL